MVLFSHLSLFYLQVTKLETLSPHWDLVDAPCEYASYCGGCKTQNLSYEAQLRYKEQQVHELLTHVGKFSQKELEFHIVMKPIVPCEIQFHYRNKVSKQAVVNFVACLHFGCICGYLMIYTWHLYVFHRGACLNGVIS